MDSCTVNSGISCQLSTAQNPPSSTLALSPQFEVCLISIFLMLKMDFLSAYRNFIFSENFPLLYNLIFSLFSISTQNIIIAL